MQTTIMKISIRSITTILLGYILITSCKKTIDTEAENDIKFDSIEINEKYHLLGDSTNPFCTLESNFIFPIEYKDEEVLGKINRYFLESFFGLDFFPAKDSVSMTPKEAMNLYIQQYITDYKELESDFKTETEKPSQESWYAYYEALSNEILYNKCDLLSYVVYVEYYTGGAHGGSGYNNHVLHLKTGEEVNETTIFIEDYQDSLAQIIINTIATDNDLTNPGELENIGFFSIDEIYPNGNFYIDENGITYTYNVYEIAPFALGRTDVFLSYEKIRHLLKKNSPIAPIAFY